MDHLDFFSFLNLPFAKGELAQYLAMPGIGYGLDTDVATCYPSALTWTTRSFPDSEKRIRNDSTSSDGG